MNFKKYFNSSSKKRELSSETSTDSHDPKNVRDSGLDDSNNPDDVFTAKDYVLQTKLRFYTTALCMLKKKMQGIHSEIEETKMSQTKCEQRLMDLDKTIKFICEKYDEFERDKAEKEKNINELQKNVNVSVTIEYLRGSLDRQEHYSSRNCLLIHGLLESTNKNTNKLVIETIKVQMGKKVKQDEIDHSYRLDAFKNNGKSRPIVIKFSRYSTRCRIFKNKSMLKGKNTSAKENLTKKRMEALKRNREEHDFENVWINEGKIIYKDVSKRNKIIKIKQCIF